MKNLKGCKKKNLQIEECKDIFKYENKTKLSEFL